MQSFDSSFAGHLKGLQGKPLVVAGDVNCTDGYLDRAKHSHESRLPEVRQHLVLPHQPCCSEPTPCCLQAVVANFRQLQSRPLHLVDVWRRDNKYEKQFTHWCAFRCCCCCCCCCCRRALSRLPACWLP